MEAMFQSRAINTVALLICLTGSALGQNDVGYQGGWQANPTAASIPPTVATVPVAQEAFAASHAIQEIYGGQQFRDPYSTTIPRTEVIQQILPAEQNLGLPGTPFAGPPLSDPPGGMCSEPIPHVWPFKYRLAPQTPSISGAIDWLFLGRTGVDERLLLYHPITMEQLLFASDLDLSTETGRQFEFAGYACNGSDFQVIYQEIDFAEGILLSSDALEFEWFGGFPAVPQQEYRFNYRSDYDSIESNFRKRTPLGFAFLVGVRRMSIDEVFDIIETLSGPNDGYFSATENEMLAAQVGTDFMVWNRHGFGMFGFLKGGVFDNETFVSADATNVGGTMPLRLRRRDHENGQFVEGRLGFVAPFSPTISLRAGYHILWIDDIALAPNQSDDFSIFTQAGAVDYKDAYYQGGFLGLEFVY